VSDRSGSDAATRVSLALLARLFDWRGALVVVQPATMIRWHRAGWRLLWRMKSRPVGQPIPIELRELIRRMARENVLWGEERIANELLLKLGIRISPRTVRKYLPKRPPGDPRRPALVDVPEESCKGHPRLRLLRRRHGDVSDAVRVRRHRARHAPPGARERDDTPECGLDAAAAPRGDRDADDHKYLIHDRDSIFAWRIQPVDATH
jgi:hypothetical protein